MSEIQKEKERAERRIYVTFTEGQMKIINYAVEIGYASGRNELIRMALNRITNEIMRFNEIQKKIYELEKDISFRR